MSTNKRRTYPAPSLFCLDLARPKDDLGHAPSPFLHPSYSSFTETSTLNPDHQTRGQKESVHPGRPSETRGLHALLRSALTNSVLLWAVGAMAACVPGIEPSDEPPGDVMEAASSAVALAPGDVTIQGRLFFNDRRQDGLFSVRRTPAGMNGTRCSPTGLRNDGTPCDENWLAAQYVVFDVVERDTASGPGCVSEEILATATVNKNGDYSVTFPAADPCFADAQGQSEILLRARLRFCGTDYCFSVDNGPNNPYRLFHPQASAVHPLPVSAGDQIAMTDMHFNLGGTDPTVANDYSIAANYYASLVDTVLTLHRDNDIPFYKAEFGEVQVLYPSTRTGSATALSPTEIALIARTDWIKGGVVAHEYGHVVMQRAWDGSYGWDGVGNGGVSWNVSTITERRIAFKEGFANFISRAVFTETQAYDDPIFDDNATKPLPGSLGEGSRWVTNVNKLLSDWLDTRFDDDPTLAGGGDHFAASLYSVWYNIRRMYVDVAIYGGDYLGGLTICDYIDYYLDVRKSAAAVGQATHDDYVALITDLIYNNNIACWRPAP